MDVGEWIAVVIEVLCLLALALYVKNEIRK